MPRPLAIMLATLLPACAPRGAGWHTPSPAPAQDATISLVALGEPAPGRTQAQVAAELDAVLVQEKQAGRTPIVLWMGNQGDPGASALVSTVSAHVRDGTPSFAVLGAREWASGDPSRWLRADAQPGAQPWALPDHNYVLRVGRDGSARVVSACTAAGVVQCGIEPDTARGDPGAALVDLVLVDTAPWMFPPPPRSEADARARDSLAQLEALVDALARMEPARVPPRILVSHLPIEAAGIHGLGGRRPVATFHQLPPSLQGAIEAGLFVGALGGLDRSLQATADVSDAVKRSAKVWVEAPFFQVVSGASARPVASTRFAGGQIRGFRSLALVPELYSPWAGFARLVISPRRVDVVLHTRRAGRWTRGTLSFALERPRHPVESPSPPMTPCLRCDPARGAADADKWSARPR